LRLGPANVLVKGGHLREGEGGAYCTDVLVGSATVEPVYYRSPRLDTPHTHGTGCTLSAAIASGLALGLPLPEAVQAAKRYLDAAIAQAVKTGSGIGSLWHAAHRMSVKGASRPRHPSLP